MGKNPIIHKRTVSELRKKASRPDRIKHGFNIPILEETRGCDNCPVKDCCDLRETFTIEQRKNGCNAVTQTYLNILKEFEDLPTMLAKDLVALKTELRLQEVIDRKEGKLLSDVRLRAMKVANEMSRNLAKVMELKEKRVVRRGKHVPQTLDMDEKVQL